LISRIRYLNRDEIMAVGVPLLCYWILAIVFHCISALQLPFFEQYKVQPPTYLVHNKVTMIRVILQVLLQHVIQAAVTLLLIYVNIIFQISDSTAPMSITKTIPKYIIAALFFDTWQYWIHRWMQENTWLYRNVHSVHHQLYITYAFGALYNHPLEAFLLDTCGGAVTSIITDITPIESTIFFSIAMMKTVDDHCGYNFPWDPFPRLFHNNATYHDIHHQIRGIKFNFSQPFFCFWDRFMGTEWDDKKRGSIYVSPDNNGTKDKLN